MGLPEFSIRLPIWVGEFLEKSGVVFTTIEERMRFVIDLARQNVEQKTGGPFGAAIFDKSGAVISAGVNIVEASNCSILHAEIVAIALAQKRLGRYDIGGGGKIFYELFASAEPCAMCLGAIPWSGVSRIVCSARDEDARRIGFDEGLKPADWQRCLEQRGIEVVRDILSTTTL